MTGRQKLIIGLLGLFVAIELCVGAYIAYTRVFMPAQETVSQATPGTATLTPTVTETFTPAPMPTNTLTPTSVYALTTTATATRVVVDTATPTITLTPSQAATPTASPSPTYTRVIRPAQPTSAATANGFQVVASQNYTTSNHFFVMFAQIKTGGNLAAGYRIQGTHQPSGLTFESAPSCHDMCKASGPYIEPEACCNELCTPEWDEYVAPPMIQEGNVVLEAPLYDTGTYDIRILDAAGQPVSNVFPIPIDYYDRRWFFYVFNR